MMNNRIEYIDTTRGIAMLLVILGHCCQTNDCTLNAFILSFHMSLFFFLSGIFAKSSKDMNKLMGGVKIKMRSVFLPQILLVMLGGIKPIVISIAKHSDLNILETFNLFRWWFLPTLFMCIISYMVIGSFVDLSKQRNKIIYMISSLILIFVSRSFNVLGVDGFYRCIQIVPTATFFYVMGSFMQPYLGRLSNRKSSVTSMFAIVALGICFVIANINSPVLWYKNDYGNLPLFLLSSILGCFSIFYFSMFIKVPYILKYVGKYCVAFYVWQFLIVSLSLSVSSRIVGLISSNGNVNNNVTTILAFTMALPTLYLIVFVTTKYLPVIYGYKNTYSDFVVSKFTDNTRNE